jgi:hypothetical protein
VAARRRSVIAFMRTFMPAWSTGRGIFDANP